MSTSRTFCSGVTRAITPMSSISRVGLLVAELGELGAGDGAALDAELARDRLRGDRVVAGDHPDLDAGGVRDGDRRLRGRPRRVDDADQREQREVVHQREQVGAGVEGRRRRSPCARWPSRAGPARRAARSRPCSGRRKSSSTAARSSAGSRCDAGAGQQLIGRALDEAADHVAAGLVGHAVEGRHQLVGGVERQLGHARVALARQRRGPGRPSRRARPAHPRSGRRSSRRCR